MEIICPKCKKKGKFSWFEQADETGIIAMVTHKTGRYEKVIDILGNERLVEIKERHFLTQKELDTTPWFREWKERHDKQTKKWAEEYSKKMDKIYEEEYWKEVEKECEAID